MTCHPHAFIAKDIMLNWIDGDGNSECKMHDMKTVFSIMYVYGEKIYVVMESGTKKSDKRSQEEKNETCLYTLDLP